MFGLLALETLESRLATYSCPRGVPGRVHSIRLRRWFLQGRQLSSASRSYAEIETSEPNSRAEYWGLPKEKAPSQEESQVDIFVPQGQEALGTGEPLFDPTQWTEKDIGVLRMLKNKYGSALRPDKSKPLSELQVLEATLAHISYNFFEALKMGKPQSLMDQLPKEAEELAFLLRLLPPTNFSEALRLLDPQHFIARHEEFHKEVGPKTSLKFQLADVNHTGYFKFSRMFLQQASTIIKARMQYWTPTLGDYKFLFKAAKAVGDLGAARSIWAVMSSNPNIRPDAECFNYVFATFCLDQELANDIRRHRLRIIPRNTEPRMRTNVPFELNTHTIGGETGIKTATSLLFQRMIESGVSGTTETFAYLMIAMARENDLRSVEQILMNVWEIDVPHVLSDAPEKPARQYRPDSPFYINDHLLFAIAHCYGINSQVANALVLIDYISRQYSITISSQTWNELLQWTFVSSQRTNKNRKYSHRDFFDDGKSIPTLDKYAVSRVWNTMVSEPYNIEPTMEMFNRLIINLIEKQSFGEVQENIAAAHDKFVVPELKKLVYLVTSLNISTAGLSPSILGQRLDDANFTRLRVKRNHMYMKRWLRKLFKEASMSVKQNLEFQGLNVPNLVMRYAEFMPRVLKYDIAMGCVELNCESTKEWKLRMRRRGKEPSMEGKGVKYWNDRHTTLRREEFGRLEVEQGIIEVGKDAPGNYQELEPVLQELEGMLDQDESDDDMDEDQD